MTTDELSKRDDVIEQLSSSQKDNARGILQVIKAAEGMDYLENMAAKIRKAKSELSKLMDAHYMWKMFNPDHTDSTEKRPLAELLDSDRIRGVSRDVHSKAITEYKLLLSMEENSKRLESICTDQLVFKYESECTLNDIKPEYTRSAEQLYTVLNMGVIDEFVRKKAIKEFIYLTEGFSKMAESTKSHGGESLSDNTFIVKSVKGMDSGHSNLGGSRRKRTNDTMDDQDCNEPENMPNPRSVHSSYSHKHQRNSLEKSISTDEASWSPPTSHNAPGDQEDVTKRLHLKDSSSSPKQSRRHVFNRSYSTSSAEEEERGLAVEPMGSLRESLVLDQARSPLKELATSYREKGRVSEELSQSVLEEVRDLYGKHKNFKMKFPRQARLSESFSQDIEDIPDVPDSSFKNVMKFLRSVDRDDELYRDAVQECAELVESEQKYYLAKSTNVSLMIPQPDRHGNVVLTRKEYDELQAELTKKTQEVDELSSRLSRMASQQMTEGNPNIADLSDRFRPTKIGEMFGQLYDDEWAEAFEALKEKSEVSEDDDEFQVDILRKLVHIVQKAFDFSSKETERQLQSIKAGLLRSSRLEDLAASSSSPQDSEQEVESFCLRTAKDVRKKLASHSWKKAAEKFQRESVEALILKHGGDQRLKDYANKCTELTWYMSVQDPSMVLLSPGAGDKLNTAEFCYHGRKGKTVELCVWPALFLHEGGPLVSKGHILPME